MRLIDADELIKGRVENDPVRIAAMCAPTACDVQEMIRELDDVFQFTFAGDDIRVEKEAVQRIFRSRGIVQKPHESPEEKRLREREEFFREV